jgi:phosphoglycolate phosphatase
MAWKGVVFDLDGTLLDTRLDIADAMNRVLKRHGFPLHGYEAYGGFIGDGAGVLVRRALPGDRPEAAEECLAEFLVDYGAHWNLRTRLYQGVDAMLSGVVRLGLRMAILTNKPASTAIQCVEFYLRRWHFDVVLGQQDGLPRKPDPSGARRVAALLGLLPAELLYVGDTGTDMETATGAGMFPVGALWGFRPERELRASGAEVVIATPGDLLRILLE